MPPGYPTQHDPTCRSGECTTERPPYWNRRTRVACCRALQNAIQLTNGVPDIVFNVQPTGPAVALAETPAPTA